jgi:ribonuclease BN (tRNA processing enzyme)
MKLQLLGTGGYHPSERRQTACFMLPELGIVLDAGSAMFRVRNHLVTDSLDIFLSHAHLDHTFGLSFLLDVLWQKQVSRVTIHGTRHALDSIQEHLFAPALFPVAPTWEVRTLDEETPLPGGGLLTHFPLIHPGGSMGYRLDWGDRSLAYVTDTTATEDCDYAAFLHGVDLLVHECYFDDTNHDFAQLTGHSCTTPVAELARRANVGRLILVHVNPLDEREDPVGLEIARGIFPKTELATDGMEVEF